MTKSQQEYHGRLGPWAALLWFDPFVALHDGGVRGKDPFRRNRLGSQMTSHPQGFRRPFRHVA